MSFFIFLSIVTAFVIILTLYSMGSKVLDYIIVLTVFYVLLYFCYKIDMADKKLYEEYNTENNSGDAILLETELENYLKGV